MAFEEKGERLTDNPYFSYLEHLYVMNIFVRAFPIQATNSLF